MHQEFCARGVSCLCVVGSVCSVCVVCCVLYVVCCVLCVVCCLFVLFLCFVVVFAFVFVVAVVICVCLFELFWLCGCFLFFGGVAGRTVQPPTVF